MCLSPKFGLARVGLVLLHGDGPQARFAQDGGGDALARLTGESREKGEVLDELLASAEGLQAQAWDRAVLVG